MKKKAFRPKKRFGQNFLHDKNIISKIISAIRPKPEQNIVEIGPGLGALTTALLHLINNIEVIELDRELIPHLQKQCKNLGEIIIHQADAINFDFNALAKTPVRIVGNLPYNVATPIIFNLLSHIDIIEDMHFMLQKEVAERIASPHGSKAYGILSVLLQNWFKIEYCFTVNENVFYPPPKVKSAVVRLTRNDITELDCDEVLLFKVVKMVFNQRRKTIRNTLKSILPNISQSDHPYFSKRPEQLSPTDFIELTNVVSQMTSAQSSNTK